MCCLLFVVCTVAFCGFGCYDGDATFGFVAVCVFCLGCLFCLLGFVAVGCFLDEFAVGVLCRLVLFGLGC